MNSLDPLTGLYFYMDKLEKWFYKYENNENYP
jgi:hypothetical protein